MTHGEQIATISPTMNKQKPPRQDRIDDAVRACDEIFQEHARLNPDFAIETRTDEVRKLLASVFDPSTAKTKNTQREIAGRVAKMMMIMHSKNEQMRDNATWQEKRGATKEQRAGAQRTMPKTVQDILSDKDNVMVFQDSELQDAEALEKAMRSIIINPDNIHNTLLKNLGLEERQPPKGTKQLNRLAMHADLIGEIKEAMLGLEPFMREGDKQKELRYFRLMRIGKGKNRGYLLGTVNRDIEDENGNFEPEKGLFMIDLRGAERRIAHIRKGYNLEVKKLAWIKECLEDVHEELARWNEIKDTEGLLKLKKIMLEVAESLKKVRAKDKVALKRRIAASLTLKDSRGRPNPGAMRAHLLKTIPMIEPRKAAIANVSAFLGRDEARVCEQITEEESPIHTFLEKVEKYGDQLHMFQGIKKISETKKQEIIRNLEKLLLTTHGMRFEPDISFGEQYRPLIEQLIERIRNPQSQDEEIAQLFLQIFLIAKIQRAYHKTQKVYKKVSLNGEENNFTQLHRELTEIHDELRKSRVAGHIQTKAYLYQYIQIYKLLNSARKRCEEAGAKESTIMQMLRKLSTLPLFERLIEKMRILMQQDGQETEEEKENSKNPSKPVPRLKKRLKEFDWKELIQSLEDL